MEEADVQAPKSWNILQNRIPDEIYVFHKFFPSGEDVIVSINKRDDGYEIKSSAVSRTTEPSNTVHDVANTLSEAVKLAKTRCEWWDEFLSSYWKKKSQ
jgi:hypothetical protein